MKSCFSDIMEVCVECDKTQTRNSFAAKTNSQKLLLKSDDCYNVSVNRKSIRCKSFKVLSVIKTTFLLSLVLSSRTATAQEWAAPPEDQSSHKGTDVMLACGISGRTEANSIVLWQQLYHNGTLLANLFSNNDSWTSNPRYTVHRHASTPGVEGFDLRITQLEEFDDKIYACEIKLFDSRRATVTVLGKLTPFASSFFRSHYTRA